MRRQDKLKNINKLNISLLNEHHAGDFPTELLSKSVESFLDELKSKDKKSYDLVETIIQKNFK